MNSGSNTATREKTQVLVQTAGLSNEEWLAYRRQGIGGSDAAAVLGISPFRTARDLYYDKLNIVSAADDTENWVALEVGHLLEDLVARIFEQKTGYPIFQIKSMFRHPRYPFMLADIDYFVTLKDGRTAILEIKTTNSHAAKHWWQDGAECIPPYYESQGRHYMAVMDIDLVFFCCMYGNSADEVIIRRMERDRAYEAELIFLESNFWERHVLAHNPPPYIEDGDLVMKSVARHLPPADEAAPGTELDLETARALLQYLQLQQQKQSLDSQARKLEKEMKRLKGCIVTQMGSRCTALCSQGGQQWIISYDPVQKTGINKDDLARLKLDYPEIYEQYVTVSTHRRFAVKPAETAAEPAAA